VLGSLLSNVQVFQGAEACVWSTVFLDRKTIVKQRFSKKYRHPVLDKSLTCQRLKAEVRNMTRARKLGVLTPVPFFVETGAASIYMEFVEGKSVKQVRPLCDLSEVRPTSQAGTLHLNLACLANGCTSCAAKVTTAAARAAALTAVRSKDGSSEEYGRQQ
jgi:tRNA A-37 threonylcarbamoyl transferase component Bud32